MATFTERYTLKNKDSMELAITVDDPVFLREPFTFVGELVRSSEPLAATWDCDPETSLRELYSTVNNPYPDDTAAERILGR
jgi:hypothetical protein